MKPAMPKKIILLVLLLAIGALVLVGVLQRKSRSKVNSAATLVSAGTSSHISGSSANLPVIRFVKNPESAPPLQAQDLLGKPITKENWGGKVVLVNFWATWCPPCREEIPELLELEKEYKGQLQIVGISEDDDPP
jgi:thiol-disulfide isomerase/thioredoxin